MEDGREDAPHRVDGLVREAHLLGGEGDLVEVLTLGGRASSPPPSVSVPQISMYYMELTLCGFDPGTAALALQEV